MNTKIYVNGGIVIETPFFKYKNAGAKSDIVPEGAEILYPKNEINGEPCLIIREEKDKDGKMRVMAPTFFKEYYAKSFFSTLHSFATFFSNSIDDCFDSFYSKRDELMTLLDKNDVHQATSQTLYRLLIVGIIAALDTLISDVILYKATKDRLSFIKAVDFAVPQNKKSDVLERIIGMWCDNIIDSAEQDVIDAILKKSYASSKEIKKGIQLMYDVQLPDVKFIDDYIHYRHLIAHRNGREKNGNYIVFDKNKIHSIIGCVNNYVTIIYKLIS